MDWTPRDTIGSPWMAVLIYFLFLIALLTAYLTIRVIL